MQLHRTDGGDVSSSIERARRARVRVAEGYECALAELEPSDDDYPAMCRQVRLARIAAGLPRLRAIS